MAFAGGHKVEFGERGGQLAPGCAKRARRGVDFAEHGDGQQPSRRQAFDDRPVEAAVPEFVAEDDVDGRPGRQAVVKIDQLEPAAIANPAAPGQISRLTNGHRGDVEPHDVQAPAGQPDAANALPAREI